MSVRFNLTKRKDYPDTRPVSVRVIVRREKRNLFSRVLPLSVAPSRWSTAKQRVKPSMPGATEINARLDELRTYIESLLLTGMEDEDLISKVSERLGRSTEPEQPDPSILDHYTAFEAMKATRARKGTLSTYRALRGHLESFLRERGQQDAAPDAIRAGFLDDFVQHLAGEGLGNSTVNKLLTRLRGFLTWLHDRDLIERVPKAKRLPTANNPALYLSAEELKAMLSLDLTDHPEGFAAARDLFIVCACTGQRFSDVAAMKWQHVHGFEQDDAHGLSEGGLTWHLAVRKTNATVRVPLVGPARAIVAKRKEAGERTPVPSLSNQRANACLKEVAQLAGLTAPVTTVKNVGGERRETTRPKWECITTHVARKTFVTLSLQKGVRPQELLGFTHDDLRTLRFYAGQDETKRRKQITEAFGKIG